MIEIPPERRKVSPTNFCIDVWVGIFALAPASVPTYIHPMIDLFKRLIGRTEGAPPTQADARAAVATILVEAAHADGTYDVEESTRIARVLAARYGLSEAEAVALRSEGETAQAMAVDLVSFTRAVKEAVPHEDRISVIEAVWEVIYADGVREMYESALIRKLCGLLHLEDRDAGLARQRVAARLGLE